MGGPQNPKEARAELLQVGEHRACLDSRHRARGPLQAGPPLSTGPVCWTPSFSGRHPTARISGSPVNGDLRKTVQSTPLHGGQKQRPADGEGVPQTGGLQMGLVPQETGACRWGNRSSFRRGPVFQWMGGQQSPDQAGRTRKVVFTWSISKHPPGPARQSSRGCAALGSPGGATTPTRRCRNPQGPDVFRAALKAAVCSPANPPRTNSLSLEAGASAGP